MVKITVTFYDNNLHQEVVRTFYGKTKEKAEARWHEYEGRYTHQQARSVLYN